MRFKSFKGSVTCVGQPPHMGPRSFSREAKGERLNSAKWLGNGLDFIEDVTFKICQSS